MQVGAEPYARQQIATRLRGLRVTELELVVMLGALAHLSAERQPDVLAVRQGDELHAIPDPLRRAAQTGVSQHRPVFVETAIVIRRPLRSVAVGPVCAASGVEQSRIRRISRARRVMRSSEQAPRQGCSRTEKTRPLHVCEHS